MPLIKYKSKRNLKVSKEPAAKIKKSKAGLIFVVQEHHARRLHFDLRLEAGGVLKSWAVPKEPSMDPSIKRLAIQVEDHPYAYKDFEGVIPEGYGAGTVKIWDRGTYDIDAASAKESEKMLLQGLKKGSVHFSLHGKKLKGDFSLVRLKRGKENSWLLIKKAESQFSFSNLDKVYWPDENITKGDLLRYYASVSKWILPHLHERPESLKRFPNGIQGNAFFQKNVVGAPKWVTTHLIAHANKDVHYVLIQDAQTLLYLVNLGCIEFHPHMARIASLHNPDYLIFDLDPKGASFDKVVRIAQELHRVLEKIGVKSCCKTSGATGLHIAVPLGGKYSYDHAKRFAEIIALIVAQRLPEIATLKRSISKRNGKVYIDCGQNHFGQTVVAPYSVRARPNAPVSTPLKWCEVKKGLDPKKFTLKTTLRRLKKYGDLYALALGKGIDLEAALERLQ